MILFSSQVDSSEVRKSNKISHLQLHLVMNKNKRINKDI